MVCGEIRLSCILITITAAAALTGCGQKNTAVTRENAVPHREPQHQTIPLAAPEGQPGEAANISFFDPQTLTKLMGTYTGTIQGWAPNGEAFSQPYTLTLVSSQVGGRTMAYATFQSGQSGDDSVPISFSSWVAPGLTGMYVNGVSVFSFVSQQLDIPIFSEFPVAVEVILSLGYGLNFVPNQSAIFIKDCRFSQGVECGNDLQDVWFLDDLGKRN